MRAVAVFSMAFVGTIVSCASASADLGNCFVLSACDGKLGRACEMILTKYIYDAYSASSNSAEDLLFVLEIAGDYSPGAYSVQKAKLILGETWPIQGYKIRAGDLDGIMNGVVEIKKAFDDGRIYELKSGTRSGLLAEPLYDQ